MLVTALLSGSVSGNGGDEDNVMVPRSKAMGKRVVPSLATAALSSACAISVNLATDDKYSIILWSVVLALTVLSGVLNAVFARSPTDDVAQEQNVGDDSVGIQAGGDICISATRGPKLEVNDGK